MKKIITCCFILSCTTFFSCEDKNDKISEEITENTPVNVKRVSIDEFSPKFQYVVKSDTGIIRNIDFNSTIEDLWAMEDTASIVEKSENFVNFSIDLDSLEGGEVLYYYDENEYINKIEVNVFPKNASSREGLFREFIKYFTLKYGEPYSEIEEVKIWRVEQDNLLVEMRMLGNAKVMDIQIDFNKIDEE